ncbi:MAG: TonB-dependent receptor [Pirellulales bacterium]|nr:TonB-dependent receptor [Pirellulales bacterium]
MFRSRPAHLCAVLAVSMIAGQQLWADDAQLSPRMKLPRQDHASIAVADGTAAGSTLVVHAANKNDSEIEISDDSTAERSSRPRGPAVQLAQPREPTESPANQGPYSGSSSPAAWFAARFASCEIRDFAKGADTEGNYPIYARRAPSPSLEEQIWLNDPGFDDELRYFDEQFFPSAFQQPLAPLQPLQPVQPQTLAPIEPTFPGSFNTLGMSSIAELAAAVSGSPAQGVGQAQATTLATTDLGGLLQSANSVQSVNTTRRSPVALDPNIRGYKFGQIYSQATGAFYFPVRQDLDTMLSKIDPGMIQDVVVIPGPYGLRYGPGFSFIDIITQDTPRYQNGPESHTRLNGNIRTNGGQLYGRATAYGGNENYGYRISYGDRKGSDYVAGNGLSIPSSYHNQDVWAQFGFDLNKHQRVEYSYLRLDQTDTEYAAQFFDVDFLGTNATTLRMVDDDPSAPWTKLTMEGYYNQTNFTGSITPSKRRPDFPVIQRVEFSLDQEFPGTVNTVFGNTLGSNVASGARLQTLFGDLDDVYFRSGVDFRYLEQTVRENFSIRTLQVAPPGPPIDESFFTNLPHSRLRDEGLFAEYGFAMTDRWDVALGARVDWVDTIAERSQVRPDTNLDVDELSQSNALYAYYLTNQFELSDTWGLRLGYGYAQRPPTLTERYADGVFLGILQSGFTRVIGTDTLHPERAFQMDVGLNTNYDNVRGSATWFYSWVIDYATFEGVSVVNFFDAKLVRYINTPLASLTGFELVGEWDWSRNVSPFAKMKYVQGTDETLGAPLPAIPPLESTVGLNFHDPRRTDWEFEVGARMVATQNRLGEILVLGRPTVIEERTGGFTAAYLRTAYHWTIDFHLVAGIDNLFNRAYQEHLDLRLLGPTGFPAPPTRVLSPGFTPYFGVDWTF